MTASAAAQRPSDPPAKAFGNTSTSYQPITCPLRLNWAVKSTIGRVSLAAGLFSAGFGTAVNRPREYGPDWEGFGKRYGMRFRGIATGNLMEASVGALWGDDPRYFRATGQPVKGRIKNVIVMTFAAAPGGRRAGPGIRPICWYFMSNTWRADRESGVGDACLRTALGFAGRMGGNAFAEFWPTLTKRPFRKHR
jgi:hypothetical protein